MGYKKVCVEIDGVFYESLHSVGRAFKRDYDVIRRRCLSNKWLNYKMVPYRVVYTEKKCSICKKTKPLDEFSVMRSHKDGFSYLCKECDSVKSKNYHIINKERLNNKAKEYRINNPEKDKETKARYKKTHKKERNARQNKRRKTDLAFRINSNMSSAIRYSLKNKKDGAHREDLVDYTIKELMAHLESKFTEGMNWENYGKGGWEIDHIVAICHFDITSTDCQEFRDCWALNNLQPMWHPRNMEKGTKPMHPKYLIKPNSPAPSKP